jgi:hypothetical protein
VTTADIIKTPRSKQPVEFPYVCGGCGGPLVPVQGRVVPVYVHARHAAWAANPHEAVPLNLHADWD